MDNKSLVSVVVPIYNASKYLRECIESVLKQDYIYFELILVDDGSKDESLSICKEYEEKDKRVVVVHQENGGVSSARNNGIEHASGDYLTFIDSDDIVESNYLSVLLSHIEKDTSMVILNYKHLNMDGSLTPSTALVNYKTGKYSYEDFKGVAIDDGTLNVSPLGTCWTILFKLDLVKKFNLRFVKGIKMGEDGLFTLSYFYNAKESLYLDLDHSPYLYRDNNTSSTYKMDTEEINGVDKVEVLLKELLTDLLEPEVLSTQIYRRRVTCFITHMILLARSKNLNYKDFKSYYKNKEISLAVKSLDLSRTPGNKKLFINLLKLHLLHLTYLLIKFKFGR